MQKHVGSHRAGPARAKEPFKMASRCLPRILKRKHSISKVFENSAHVRGAKLGHALTRLR